MHLKKIKMTDEQNQKKSLFTKAYQSINIEPKTQEELNKPTADDEKMSEENSKFLALVIELIQKETINLLTPSSLINYKVYDQLTEELKAKADYNAILLLGTLRDIKTLLDLNDKETYQIKNLIHQVRTTKERLENDIGDVYII
jgi:hypothetical protein